MLILGEEKFKKLEVNFFYYELFLSSGFPSDIGKLDRRDGIGRKKVIGSWM
ncbi:MAG: hypothetical protein QW040_03495 [Candidatus Aenigmatarchaeota archaeon]